MSIARDVAATEIDGSILSSWRGNKTSNLLIIVLFFFYWTTPDPAMGKVIDQANYQPKIDLNSR